MCKSKCDNREPGFGPCERKVPFSMVDLFVYYEPEESDLSLRIPGIVKALRDSQFLYNRQNRGPKMAKNNLFIEVQYV